jgi:DNA-binding NtrC family response regulator
MLIIHLDDKVTTPVALRRALARRVSDDLDYRIVSSPAKLWDLLACLETRPSALILDYDLGLSSCQNGVEVLGQCRREGFGEPIIILSGHEDPRLMSLAIQDGAAEFLSKADPIETLAASILRVVQRSQRAEHEPLEQASTDGRSIVGTTMSTLNDRLQRAVLRRVSPILIQGESGTGKEQVAHLLEDIHRQTSQGHEGIRGPFLRVNCATFANETLESELFGHEKGAFTGADRTKKGIFEAAHGGWVFLDEVAKLSDRAQASLLRVLESGEIRPLGSHAIKRLDVRIVAATNDDLDRLASLGRFRQDLLERLRAYAVTLPPLRERSLAERSELLEHLMARLTRETKTTLPFELDAAARRMILAAPFRKSNIRELWHVLQSAAVECDDGRITIACLPKAFLVEQWDAQRSSDAATLDSTTAITHDEDLLKGGDGQAKEGYTAREQRFFRAVLEEILTLQPEQARSVRSLASSLQLGRHLVTRKLLGLAECGLLPQGLGHLVTVKQLDVTEPDQDGSC